MALAKRGYHARTPPERQTGGFDDDHDDHNKTQQQNEDDRAALRRRRCIVCSIMMAAVYTYQYPFQSRVYSLVPTPGTRGKTVSLLKSTENGANELYPFLSSRGSSKTPFPVIPSLENCTVNFKPPEARKEESQWRKPFWIPSFPSSGASNPTNKGDLSKELIGKLTGLSNKPVKNYHMSMRKQLKRCHGVSETVGCTQGHPIVPIQPEKQRENFQPHAIVFVRNFVSAFPASLTDKNIAYHNAEKQNTIAEYKRLRDEWVQPTFESWKNLLDWWSTERAYDVAMFIAFEDLLTTNRETGRAVLEELSTVLKRGGFEVASSQEDLDCIWYTTIREEWTRQQTIMEYIPIYTTTQKEWIVSQIQQYIQEVSNRDGKPSDSKLVAILNRYLREVSSYVLVEQ